MSSIERDRLGLSSYSDPCSEITHLAHLLGDGWVSFCPSS